MHSHTDEIKIDETVGKCLNPCFNGRCTRTDVLPERYLNAKEGLNPCFNGRCTRTYKVSIIEE